MALILLQSVFWKSELKMIAPWGQSSHIVSGLLNNTSGSCSKRILLSYTSWLLCNGQSCTSYPALVAVIGNNVPNLEGRFLEGTISSPRSFKDAGVPNITGAFNSEAQWGGVTRYALATGAFYPVVSSRSHLGSSTGGGNHDLYFDASRCSSIYGASDTVQPAAYLVMYYIKAA